MARSLRHTNICGFTSAQSEKWDKRTYNRMLRRKFKFVMTDSIMKKNEIDPILPEKKDVSDPWEMNKDGKMWFGDLKDKCPEIYKKAMRK